MIKSPLFENYEKGFEKVIQFCTMSNPKVLSGLLIHQEHVRKIISGQKCYEIRPKNSRKIGEDIAIVEVAPRKSGSTKFKKIVAVVHFKNCWKVDLTNITDEILFNSALSASEFKEFAKK